MKVHDAWCTQSVEVPPDDPANCFGAPALMEKKHLWDEIDLDDDEDLGAIIDLAREALSASQSCEDEPNADFVKYLIEHGFDINAKVPGHDCLLVKALLDNGADVNAVGTVPDGGNGYWISMDGVSPLALACRMGEVGIARLLLEA